MINMQRYFPILGWGRSYTRDTPISDLVAATIVTVMLVPQSLAYALLTGLPAEASVKFHLSEVKGPVMDKLERSGFLPHLTGKVFLSHHLAVHELERRTAG
jgi:Sulfate permease family